MKWFGMVAFAAAVAISAPAQAITISGTVTFDDDGYGFIEAPLVTTPGDYLYGFTLDAALFADLEIGETYGYDYYDAVTAEKYGGNDVPLVYNASYFDVPVVSGSLTYSLLAPYEKPPADGIIEKGYYTQDYAILRLYQPIFAARGVQRLADSVAYEVSVTALRSAAPEPAAWALLIVGFGLTGTALRRKFQAA